MKIVFFQRKPFDFHFSIERLFETIRQNLSDNISYNVFILPFYSSGILSRLKSSFAARKRQGDINHITGDIHFITPFLNKDITINTYHDFTFLKDTSGLKRFILWLIWVYLPVKYSKFITVISETTKKELIELTGCSPSKIYVIPNIISSKYSFNKKEFNKKNPNILHIGTTPNKNLNRLIEAVKDIKCQLIIIGKLTNENISLLKKHNIYFNNYYQLSDEQLEQVYIKCDILSFCSLNEGFGLPILEAQAIGRPVVTSNISSMPEVAGNSACLVDPYNINSIKNGLLKVINDDDYRNDLILKGLNNILRFDPKTIASQYENLYKKIYEHNLLK